MSNIRWNKVRRENFNGDVQGKIFTQRVLGAWTALPEVVGGMVVLFKRVLDRHMEMQRVDGI